MQHYVVKLPKSAVGCQTLLSKILWVPGTLGTHANSSPCTKIIRGAEKNGGQLFETKVVKKCQNCQ